jgi:putative ABC transport system permease protein
VSDYLPVSAPKRDGNTFYQEGKTKEDIGVSSQKWRIDYDYVKTMGMHILEGRNFSKDMASDSAGVLSAKQWRQNLDCRIPSDSEL